MQSVKLVLALIVAANAISLSEEKKDASIEVPKAKEGNVGTT